MALNNSNPSEVDTRSACSVRGEVLSVFHEIFGAADPGCIEAAFRWVETAFSGAHPGYQPIDAKYHDFEHTLQGTLCFTRLLRGYNRARAEPLLTRRIFELGILAILLHDTGYLKATGDTDGTGAKYTLTHVTRSTEFAEELLRTEGFHPEEIRAVQNMIRCTGVNTDLDSIEFQSELERKVGFALGTADLLGQMAAQDYIHKLGILYQEFEESNRHSGKTAGPGVFTSAADLRQKTPLFWEKYVLPKINRDFAGLFQFLADESGANPYLINIERNIEKLRAEFPVKSA